MNILVNMVTSDRLPKRHGGQTPMSSLLGIRFKGPWRQNEDADAEIKKKLNVQSSAFIPPQRPIRPQYNDSCEFSSLKAFLCFYLKDELAFQVAQRASLLDALRRAQPRHGETLDETPDKTSDKASEKNMAGWAGRLFEVGAKQDRNFRSFLVCWPRMSGGLRSGIFFAPENIG